MLGVMELCFALGKAGTKISKMRYVSRPHASVPDRRFYCEFVADETCSSPADCDTL